MNRNSLYQFAFIVILFSIFTGCISLGMTEKKCQELNAHKYGRMTALHTLDIHTFNKYKELCAQKYQVTLSQTEYDKGYKQGVKELCTYQGGYNLGRSGIKYRKVCAKKNELKFTNGYKKGRFEYLEAEVARLSRSVRSLKSEIFRQQIESISRSSK